MIITDSVDAAKVRGTTGRQEENSRCALWIGDMEWRKYKDNYRTTESDQTTVRTGWETNSPSVVPLSWIQKLQRTIKRMWFNNIVKWWDKCRVCKTRRYHFSCGTDSAQEACPDLGTQFQEKSEGCEPTDDSNTIKTRIELPRWVVAFPLLLYRQNI